MPHNETVQSPVIVGTAMRVKYIYYKKKNYAFSRLKKPESL